MSLLPSAEQHDLVEADRFRMLQPEDADTVKLAGQQPRARADCGSRNHKHQHALTGHPAITMFQEHQFHPLITVWSELAVIGRIQVKKRAGLGQHPTVKGAAMDGGNSSLYGNGCSVR